PSPPKEAMEGSPTNEGSTSPTLRSELRTWDLAADVSPDVLSANPHADRLGNEGVWSFYTEPDNGGIGVAPAIPAGSLLARWQSEPSSQARQKLAEDLQKLLTSDPPNADEGPDTKLYQQLSSLGGPLFSSLLSKTKASGEGSPSAAGTADSATWGLDPSLFGDARRD